MKRRYYLWSLAAVLAVTVLTVIALLSHQSNPVISSQLQRQIPFAILLPAPQAATINKPTIKYDGHSQLLSYHVQLESHDVLISEQPAPDTFSDIPGYYGKWLDSLGAHTNLITSAGTVNIVTTAKLNPFPIAVLSSNNTLLFARPNAKLTTVQWLHLFNTLQVLT